jgi:inner membrane protein
VAVGVITAELPDIDVFYAGPMLGMGKLGYLLHHRGHTHTVVFALVAALVIWVITMLVRRDVRDPSTSRSLLLLAVAGTISHIALDYTNNYGVHPWWPWDNRWSYGDAVFIVEPWLWVVSLPTLYLAARRMAVRLLWAVLLVAIVAVCWRVTLVSGGTAVTVTAGALTWGLLMSRVSPERRMHMVIGGWLLIESVFFVTTRSARQLVRDATGDALIDVVITPSPGDPFCVRALVATQTSGNYALESATVAPYPTLRPVSRCTAGSRADVDGGPSTRPASLHVTWETRWERPISELSQLVRASCPASAALRFIRMPIWRSLGSDSVQVSDARYGEGPGSFASVVVPGREPDCPRLVPPWVQPRARLLEVPPG